MYLLQIVLHVPIGSTTGLVDRHIENYHSESLKPLLLKANDRISESSENISFNVSFYKLENNYVTEIREHTFNFEKMELHTRLLYFYCHGLRSE